MNEDKEEREVTIDEESKMSLEDIFKRCTKHGIVEDYADASRFGIKDNNDGGGLFEEDDENYSEDDYDEGEEGEEQSDSSFYDSDDDEDDDSGGDDEIGWF